jgi:hypothetical protein
MKLYRFILFLFLLSACSKPKIYIPVNNNDGQTDVNDLSQVYIFFKTGKQGDTLADMHKNQIITTTHFVVHIDRRLPVKTLIPSLEWLHKKRHKKSIHYKPGFHLFFSHLDTIRQKIRLNVFDSLEIAYPFYLSPSYIKKFPKTYGNIHPVHLYLEPGNVRLDSVKFAFPLNKKLLKNRIYQSLYSAGKNLLFLNVNYNVSYDRYNDLYGFLVNLDSSRIRLAHKQFWYNPDDLKK